MAKAVLEQKRVSGMFRVADDQISGPDVREASRDAHQLEGAGRGYITFDHRTVAGSECESLHMDRSQHRGRDLEVGATAGCIAAGDLLTCGRRSLTAAATAVREQCDRHQR